jgi:riboflavin synthase alpha subunit
MGIWLEGGGVSYKGICLTAEKRNERTLAMFVSNRNLSEVI